MNNTGTKYVRIVWVELCALQGYYAARSGNSGPTFRVDLSSDLQGPRS